MAKEFIFPIIGYKKFAICHDNKKLAKKQEEMNEIETSFLIHN